MCYPRRKPSRKLSLPPSVLHLHRLERAHCVTEVCYWNSRAQTHFCVRCSPCSVAAQTTNLKFTHFVAVTAQVTHTRCDLCGTSLCAVRRVTDCPECVQWFVGFLVVIEARGIEFHELEDPTNIILDRAYQPSDFIISRRLLSFSLGLVGLARLRELREPHA